MQYVNESREAVKSVRLEEATQERIRSLAQRLPARHAVIPLCPSAGKIPLR
jgi:hypothetical protein